MEEIQVIIAKEPEEKPQEEDKDIVVLLCEVGSPLELGLMKVGKVKREWFDKLDTVFGSIKQTS